MSFYSIRMIFITTMKIVFVHFHQRFPANFYGKMTRRTTIRIVKPHIISRGVTFLQHVYKPLNIAIARQRVFVKPSIVETINVLLRQIYNSNNETITMIII